MTQAEPDPNNLLAFFAPRGVAVIGASRDPEKLSYGVIRNLLDPDRPYPGPVYPVNPKADEILGLRCYGDIASVPDPVELAVLIIPAAAVSPALEACGRRGVKAAIVISGGFREVGAEGAAREREMVAVAQRYGMRVMGPNGIGVIDTHTPLNTTFVKGMPPAGHIAFLSQSGALCGGVIDWTIGAGIGFSRLLSVGNEADVNETDMLPVLADDPASRVITLYLEDVKGGRVRPYAAQDGRSQAGPRAKSGRTAGGQAAPHRTPARFAGVHAAPGPRADRRAGSRDRPGAVRCRAGLRLPAAALRQPDCAVDQLGGPAALAADALEGAGPRLAHSARDASATRPSSTRMHRWPGRWTCWAARIPPVIARFDVVLADPACDGVLAILVPQVLIINLPGGR